MSTKTKKRNKRPKLKNLRGMYQVSSHMTLKDMKRNCVVRGMDFKEVVESTVPGLQNWLHHNQSNDIDSDLLNQYDDWLEDQLRARGKEDLIYPELRLGFIGERDDEGNTVKTKRVKGIRKKKKRREKTTDGIFSGTKKALTFQLQQDGLTMPDTVEKVLETFPDANTKSIKIWYKKSRRAHADS